MNKNIDKWYSKSIYVDIDTGSGEIIDIKEVKQNYIIVRKHKNTYDNYKWVNRKRERHRITEWIHECTKYGKQSALF